jgi:hypothetical protein
MKKFIVFLFISLPLVPFAQNVGISHDNSQPDNSAILDVKSTTKGMLIPRMTSAERTAINPPVTGLTVFDITTSSFWVYRGDIMGGWVELLHSLDKHWIRTGTDVYNLNPGNIGIGTNTPGSTLTINGTNPVIGMMNNGLANGYLQADGFNFRISTAADNPTGKLVFGTKDMNHFNIDALGRISAGTDGNFDAEFKLNGTSPRFAFLHENVQKGFMRLAGDDFKMGTYPNNSGRLVFSPKGIDKIWIDEDGLMGLGTSTPSAVLTINGIDPIIQLRNDDVDKGFVQLVGNHLRVGTNVSNAFGAFIARTKGTDRLYINHKGQMGLNNVPDDTETAFSVGEDDNGNCGIELKYANMRRGMFSFNGTNTFLTASSGNLYLYRNSSYPLIIHADGNFSMGGPDKAFGYRLSVYGKTIATEFTAMTINSWPDYVFAGNYPLMKLSDLKQYVEQNRHLPNIPPATEIEKNGVELADMSKRLTEKVEELTLYLFQLQEQIDRLKQELFSGKK